MGSQLGYTAIENLFIGSLNKHSEYLFCVNHISSTIISPLDMFQFMECLHEMSEIM